MNDREQYFRDRAEQYYASARARKERIIALKRAAGKLPSAEEQYRIEVMPQSHYDCMSTARILSGHADREAVKIKEVKAWS